MIIMVRADDRLIHGMVAVSWTSHLQPQTILVANNVAAKDSFKAMTKMCIRDSGCPHPDHSGPGHGAYQ